MGVSSIDVFRWSSSFCSCWMPKFSFFVWGSNDFCIDQTVEFQCEVSNSNPNALTWVIYIYDDCGEQFGNDVYFTTLNMKEEETVGGVFSVEQLSQSGLPEQNVCRQNEAFCLCVIGKTTQKSHILGDHITARVSWQTIYLCEDTTVASAHCWASIDGHHLATVVPVTPDIKHVFHCEVQHQWIHDCLWGWKHKQQHKPNNCRLVLRMFKKLKSFICSAVQENPGEVVIHADSFTDSSVNISCTICFCWFRQIISTNRNNGWILQWNSDMNSLSKWLPWMVLAKSSFSRTADESQTTTGEEHQTVVNCHHWGRTTWSFALQTDSIQPSMVLSVSMTPTTSENGEGLVDVESTQRLQPRPFLLLFLLLHKQHLVWTSWSLWLVHVVSFLDFAGKLFQPRNADFKQAFGQVEAKTTRQDVIWLWNVILILLLSFGPFYKLLHTWFPSCLCGCDSPHGFIQTKRTLRQSNSISNTEQIFAHVTPFMAVWLWLNRMASFL